MIINRNPLTGESGRGIDVKCFPLILVVVLITAVAYGTLAYGQSANASACQNIITNFSQTSLTERIDAYYLTGQCYHKIGTQRDVDVDGQALYAAQLAYAKAEILGQQITGNVTAMKAREALDRLYRSLHNNSVVGIEKIYRKAEESLVQSGK